MDETIITTTTTTTTKRKVPKPQPKPQPRLIRRTRKVTLRTRTAVVNTSHTAAKLREIATVINVKPRELPGSTVATNRRLPYYAVRPHELPLDSGL